MTEINNQDARLGQQNNNSTVYNQYFGREIKKFLSTPFVPEIFLGRENDLENIHRQLFEGESLLLLVNGQGGIGKTTLAAQYFLKHQNNYQHLAWVFAEQNLTDALLTLAIPLEINFPETMTATERLDVLLIELRNLNNPCLLVIDNATQDGLEKHYYALRACPNFHLLLTSRISEFEQAKTYRIEGLPEDEALLLFKKYYPKHQQTEDELFKQIRNAVGSNTLVLELLAKSLNQLNRLKTSYSLVDLLEDLKKGLLALSKSGTVGIFYHTDGSLRKAKPEAIIEAMYNLAELDEAEKKLLSIFAVLPAENVAFITLEDLLPGENLTETLLILAQKGWLDYNEADNAFKVSPVIQEITRKKNSQLFEDCRDLIYNLVIKLAFQAGTGHLLNTSFAEALLYIKYSESLVNIFKQPDHNLSLLCERLGSYYQTTGNLQKGLFFFTQYNRLRKKLLETKPENILFKTALATSYSRLGSIQTALGNLEKSIDFYEQDLQLSKELYEACKDDVKFKNNLAISYQFLGNIQSILGNLDKALDFYTQYNILEKELHKAWPDNVEFKNGLATSYSKLGNIQATLNNLDKAFEFYEQFYLLEEKLHKAWPNNVGFKNGLATSYLKLGKTQAELGNPEKALDFYEKFNILEKELYEDFPDNVQFKYGLAISYNFLGNIQADLGSLKKALGFYEQCNYLEKELHEACPDNVEFKNGLAISCEKLGNTQADLGNIEKALDFYKQYNILEKQLYEAWPDIVEFKKGLAISYYKLGFINEQDLDKSISKNYYETSKELLIQLVNHYPDHIEFKKNLEEVTQKLNEA